MRMINPGRFQSIVGDLLEYNIKAMEWLNKERKRKGLNPLPSAKKLNEGDPTVTKFEIDETFNEKLIELHVKHNTKYTGITGVIQDSFTDIWMLYLDGRFNESCPYPMFKVKK